MHMKITGTRMGKIISKNRTNLENTLIDFKTE